MLATKLNITLRGISYIHLSKQIESNNFCCAPRILRRYVHNFDDKTIHTVKDHVVEKTPITAQLWQARKNAIEADRNNTMYKQSHVAEVITKTTAESRLTLSYNFMKDYSIRDLYVGHEGDILMGKLFEDLDALAGNIAYSHCDDSNPGTDRLNLVTASVDKIVQRKPITTRQDLLLTGQVAWVGNSSLDIVMEVHNAADIVPANKSSVMGNPDSDMSSNDIPVPRILDPNSPSRLLSSYFTYVARDRATGKSARVNRLETMNEREAVLFAQRDVLQKARKAETQKVDMSSKEILSLIEAGTAIADMPALAHPNAVLMKYTGLENTLICQPQSSNTAGRVFGGFISECLFHMKPSISVTSFGSRVIVSCGLMAQCIVLTISLKPLATCSQGVIPSSQR